MPFVVEGIGIRRLKRWPSRCMGIALLRLATSITVRSKGAASEVVRLAGRPAAVSRDPAFDYIANRSVSDLMTPHEEARIQELASRPASTRLICVNVRPAARRAAQPMVSAALKRLATAMTAFARIHPARYVFFPLETETDTGSHFDTADELAGYVAARGRPSHLPRVADPRRHTLSASPRGRRRDDAISWSGLRAVSICSHGGHRLFSLGLGKDWRPLQRAGRRRSRARLHGRQPGEDRAVTHRIDALNASAAEIAESNPLRIALRTLRALRLVRLRFTAEPIAVDADHGHGPGNRRPRLAA